MLLLTGLLLATSNLVVAPHAHAANSQDFNPGNLISDAAFFNGNAMSANEIQTFLNGQVPRCTLGDPGRPAGGVYTFPNGYQVTLANSCLKDFRTDIPSLPPDGICSAISGGVMTAAQMIRAVGFACNISQKVLLVLVEKEQSLVSDTFPAQSQYDHATGFNCPDTAPCSSASAGIFKQTYSAARQLQVYGTAPFTWYPVGVSSQVAFQASNVNPNCGSSPVLIQNRATAALYYYTPYQPNQAALANLYGSGDSCSSYGNRNFWRMYTDWFGSTQVVASLPDYAIAIEQAANAAGGVLGVAQSDYVRNDSNGGGWTKLYSNGMIMFTASAGAHVIRSPIKADFVALGGVQGTLGWPTDDMISLTANGGGYRQTYQGGRLFHATGAASGYLVKGPILAALIGTGGVSGPLGWPTSPETCTALGCTQSFQNATVACLKDGTCFDSRSMDTLSASLQPGLGSSTGGYTLSSSSSGVSGLIKGFTNGLVTYSTTTGAHVIRSPIKADFVALGGVQGTLGWPTDDMISLTANGGGYRQTYQGGRLFHATGAASGYLVKGPILAALIGTGGVSGPLGWPTSPETCTSPGFCSQKFMARTISVSP
jgi:hypothetical protein